LAEDAATDADIMLFAQVADVYQAVLDQVEQRLAELGFQATTRVKTTGTLVDKLRRDPTLKLKAVHDLAGARIIVDGNRLDQDAVRDSIMDAFASCSKPPSEKDRRKTPSHGYRAVHVIVFPDDIPVEIQIRTLFQDRWAQVAESFGDMWGRGLRYGLGPDEPYSLAGPPFGSSLTRAQVVEKWDQMSDQIDRMEQLEVEIAELGKLTGSGVLPDAEALAAVRGRFDEIRVAASSLVAELGIVPDGATVSEGQP
jgi:ppGpp synthetase/RelA/SpoT-type nucleotidyltranferase